jgi:hypothetical protein
VPAVGIHVTYQIINNLHQKMTETTDNIIDRDELQEAYVKSILDEWIGKLWNSLCMIVNNNLDDYTMRNLLQKWKIIIQNYWRKVKRKNQL